VILASRLLLLSLALLLGACGKEPPAYQEQSYVFGTLVDVSIYGEDEARARAAAGEVMREFHRLHDKLHAWQPGELSALNAAFARGESMAVSPELSAMLQDAAQLSGQSGGAFNPAIGGLIALWGFQADEFKPVRPGEPQIARLVASNPQMGDLVFNPSPQPSPARGEGAKAEGHLESLPSPLAGEGPGERGVTISSRNPAVQLDLGGYAKGYALDRAAALLRERGIRNALVNIGGNIIALGRHGERAWRVGIQHPRKSGAIASLELHDGEAIGTSGDYQRYFELDGKRYCHLIDPRTGHPAQGVQAVTILTRGPRAGILSDAASKPLFLAGAGGWRAAARQMALPEAMLVDAQGGIHLTAALDKRLEFADKNIPAEVVP
jgi:thiamine biosynthesis lipoprotein